MLVYRGLGIRPWWAEKGNWGNASPLNSRVNSQDRGMEENITKEELAQLVGKSIGVSDWFTIDQDRINQFADVTKDHQFLHVDPERAATTPFGTTIAHGMLTFSMIIYLCEKLVPPLEGVQMVINYGFDKVRFSAPVKVGSRIRAASELLRVSERGGHILVKTKVTIEIEGGEKPALVAEWLTMHVCS